MKYKDVETEAREEIRHDLWEAGVKTVKEKLTEIDLAKKTLSMLEEQLEDMREQEVDQVDYIGFKTAYSHFHTVGQ